MALDNITLEKIKIKIVNSESIKAEMLKAKSYYENKTDIEEYGVIPKNTENKDQLRNADNRISHNFHQILVDEKVAYMFTYPILLDIDNNRELNGKVKKTLGDDFERKIKNIALETSNCGVAWLHYWIDESEPDNKKFKYEKVNSEEIIPIYSNGLERNLEAIIRVYTCMEEVKGQIQDEAFTYIEYWTNSTMDRYKFQGTSCSSSMINE